MTGLVHSGQEAVVPAQSGGRVAGHTPGPWIYYADLPSVDPNWSIVTTTNKLRVLANVYIEPGNGMDAANARLIAAAPDGLAFAMAHDAYMLDAGYSGPDDAALHPKAAENWRQCRAFIALAQADTREVGR